MKNHIKTGIFDSLGL